MAGDIADDLDPSPWTGGGKIVLQDIHLHDLHPDLSGESLPQNSRQPRIDLDGNHPVCPLRQFLRHEAEAGADFDDRLIPCGFGERDDPSDDVQVLQKRRPVSSRDGYHTGRAFFGRTSRRPPSPDRLDQPARDEIDRDGKKWGHQDAACQQRQQDLPPQCRDAAQGVIGEFETAALQPQQESPELILGDVEQRDGQRIGDDPRAEVTGCDVLAEEETDQDDDPRMERNRRRHADEDADRQSGGDLCGLTLQADESLVKGPDSLFQDHG